MSAVPIRYRRVVESRVEYALLLPASLPAVAELLDTVLGALRADDRPFGEATVHLYEGELVVSYTVEPDAWPVQEAAQVVNMR